MVNRSVSVILPIIRPEKAERVITAINNDPFSDTYQFEIVSEIDEERIGCPKMVSRLVEKSQHPWVMFLGDDTLPQDGIIYYALIAAESLSDHWGMVGLNDNFNDGNGLATHWMCHKNLLPLLDGEFFHTGYRHGFCDHELIRRCQAIDKYIYAPMAQLHHDHPLVKQKPWTGDYARVYRFDNYIHDLILFKRRERAGWK